ncbi:MAG: hypothetical protein ABJZ55_09385 [Fuerstiella sp.]
MNVRVLLLMIACVLTSGCCMPGPFMNPGMMQCCPVGTMGSRPLMNLAATGPARYRSFHDNLVTTRHQSLGSFRSVQQVPRPMNAWAAQSGMPMQTVCRPVCQPVAQPVYVQPAVAYQPAVNYQPRRCIPSAPVHAKPWRMPWGWGSFPKFSSLLPKQTVSDQSTFQRWLPVVNDGFASAPCGNPSCGEEVVPTYGNSYHFSNESSGEEIPYLGVTSEPMPHLSPVPAPPVEANVRYFPNSGEQHEVPKPKPKKEDSEAYYLDPPPAAEKLADPSGLSPEEAATPEAKQQPVAPVIPTMINPPQGQGDVSPASKPAMQEEINPFEDIENSEPDVSLPLEADMSQAILLVPKNVYPPLHIPSPKGVLQAAAIQDSTAFVRPVSAVSAEVPEAIESVEIDWMQPIEILRPIRQVSAVNSSVNQQMPWEAIELNQAFFPPEQLTPTAQNSRSAVVGRPRQVQRQTVVRRTVVEEAEELVPIRRVITRRRQ